MPHMRATHQTTEQQIAALERIGRFIAPFTCWDRSDVAPTVHEAIRNADSWLWAAITRLQKIRNIVTPPQPKENKAQ